MRQKLVACLCLLCLGVSARAEEAKSTTLVSQQRDEELVPILVTGSLGGTALEFLIDTGASHHGYGSHLRRFIKGDTRRFPPPQTHIRSCGPQKVSVQGVRDSAPLGSIILDLSDISDACMTHVDGVLGTPFLYDRTLVLDFEQHLIQLLDGPSDLRGETLALELDRFGRPNVQNVTLANQDVSFLIDTGSNAAITVTRDLYATLSKQDALSDESTGRSLTIDGFDEVRKARLDALQIGPYMLSDVPINESSSNKIGLAVLRQFHVAIDYTNARLTLAKNASFGEPIKVRKAVEQPKPASDQ